MASRRRVWQCGGKMRYPDRQAAKDAVRLIRYEHGDFAAQSQTPIPTRAYECALCRGFHLTSQPAKKFPSLA